ncbi:exodeoxyribonuclease V subunit alpha [Bacterioplanoides sp.]|uniref:exodeoxyribonuclease V subunit alpha n=1 Tax=Bacterioplanoides sp. TaxID=2066072 RepID=UPI003B590D0B
MSYQDEVSLLNGTEENTLEKLQQQCRELIAQRKLREIDLQLAQQVVSYELATEPKDQTDSQPEKIIQLYFACVALSASLAKGQVCLPLDRCFIRDLSAWWLNMPQLVELLSGCDNVFVVADDSEQNWQNQPLVLDPGNGITTPRLYLARYYFYEQGVYQHIRQRLTPAMSQEELIASLKQPLQQLFPGAATGDVIDWQNIAAASACSMPFAVITGGPGTGKTTTVTKLLSALLSLNPSMHIALAAPTGKAAARMTESIRGAKIRESQNSENGESGLVHADLIPDDSFTLHRLLGWTPRGYRYNRDHPLPYDCVVVDEASMIDLPMMHHLMSALSADTRLILLGDRDQLASVEAGSVLADLCDSGNEHGPSQEFAQLMQQLTGQDISGYVEHIDGGQGIQNAVAQLRVSHRFHANSGIGRLAAAVNQGNYHDALAAFEKFEDIDLHWHDTSADNKTSKTTDFWKIATAKGYQNYCKTVAKGDPKQIIQAFSEFQVLVATRQGPFGIEEVNRQIELLLRPQLDKKHQYSGAMYPGRAVMISRNDYDLGLFNGDIGILVEVPKDSEAKSERELKAAFMDSDGEVRLLLPSRLPEHETAFAMTVHKSQGSEFDQVFMILPTTWQSVITRELIYTGITRAKSHFRLLTSMHSWQAGLSARVERASGLRDKLWC